MPDQETIQATRITWSEHMGWGKRDDIRHFPAEGLNEANSETNSSYDMGPGLCGDLVPFDSIVDARDTCAISQMCKDCYITKYPRLTMADIMGGEAHHRNGTRV